VEQAITLQAQQGDVKTSLLKCLPHVIVVDKQGRLRPLEFLCALLWMVANQVHLSVSALTPLGEGCQDVL
jgi:hypothetical protein